MKTQINIVYAPQKEPDGIAYENDQGTIWRSATRHPERKNILMGWYSTDDFKPGDSFLAIEPYCVSERDYDVEFLKKFHKVFTWAVRAFEHPEIKNKIVEVNHPSLLDPPSMHTIASSWMPWKERSNEIVFIANNKNSKHHSELYSFRLQLADLLHARSKYKVSWYGDIPIKRSYYRGSVVSKSTVLSKVKFSVCTENSYDPIYTYNYFTEKMPEVWINGAVPIYMGDFSIDNLNFPEHSYIDLRTYVNKVDFKREVDIDSLVMRIEGFEENRYKNWVSDVESNIRHPNGLYYIVSWERFYQTIINTLAENI